MMSCRDFAITTPSLPQNGGVLVLVQPRGWRSKVQRFEWWNDFDGWIAQ